MRPVIGLMSGTSADAIDAAILHTDGTCFTRTNVAGSFAYDPALQARIFGAMRDPVGFMLDKTAVNTLSYDITDAHSAAVITLLDQLTDDVERPTLIGFHGQTIFHEPDGDTASSLGRCTIQLGCGKRLADATGIDVVYDVRQADMKAGGQGAPLAPIYHAALIAELGDTRPAVVVNIGGVANLTYVGAGAEPDILGFDSGPGNGLMDDYMRAYFNQPFDDAGKVAAKGHIDEDFVARVMRHDFFDKKWPKSLDRQAFIAAVNDAGLDDLAPYDAMASLLALTVQTIAQAINALPDHVSCIRIAGGGRRNQTLMNQLQTVFGDRLMIDDKVAFDADLLEAELMAYLAARYCSGLPTSFPATTGCRKPVCGGRLARPKDKRFRSARPTR